MYMWELLLASKEILAYGETIFAQQICGPKKTLLVSFQGVTQPNMKSLSRKDDELIVYDECAVTSLS